MKNVHKLPKTLWGGFIDGRLDLDFYQNVGSGKKYGILYSSRRAAKECYDDVRKVEVKEAK